MFKKLLIQILLMPVFPTFGVSLGGSSSDSQSSSAPLSPEERTRYFNASINALLDAYAQTPMRYEMARYVPSTLNQGGGSTIQMAQDGGSWGIPQNTTIPQQQIAASPATQQSSFAPQIAPSGIAPVQDTSAQTNQVLNAYREALVNDPSLLFYDFARQYDSTVQPTQVVSQTDQYRPAFNYPEYILNAARQLNQKIPTVEEYNIISNMQSPTDSINTYNNLTALQNWFNSGGLASGQPSEALRQTAQRYLGSDLNNTGVDQPGDGGGNPVYWFGNRNQDQLAAQLSGMVPTYKTQMDTAIANYNKAQQLLPNIQNYAYPAAEGTPVNNYTDVIGGIQDNNTYVPPNTGTGTIPTAGATGGGTATIPGGGGSINTIQTEGGTTGNLYGTDRRLAAIPAYSTPAYQGAGPFQQAQYISPEAIGQFTSPGAYRTPEEIGAYSDAGNAQTFTGGDYDRLEQSIVASRLAPLEAAWAKASSAIDEDAARRGIFTSGIPTQTVNKWFAENYLPVANQAGAEAATQRYNLQANELQNLNRYALDRSGQANQYTIQRGGLTNEQGKMANDYATNWANAANTFTLGRGNLTNEQGQMRNDFNSQQANNVNLWNQSNANNINEWNAQNALQRYNSRLQPFNYLANLWNSTAGQVTNSNAGSTGFNFGIASFGGGGD